MKLLKLLVAMLVFMFAGTAFDLQAKTSQTCLKQNGYLDSKKRCGKKNSCKWINGSCKNKPPQPLVPAKLNNRFATAINCAFYTAEGGSIVSAPTLLNVNNTTMLGDASNDTPERYAVSVPAGATCVKVGPDLGYTSGPTTPVTFCGFIAGKTYEVTTGANDMMVVQEAAV